MISSQKSGVDSGKKKNHSTLDHLVRFDTFLTRMKNVNLCDDQCLAVRSASWHGPKTFMLRYF